MAAFAGIGDNRGENMFFFQKNILDLNDRKSLPANTVHIHHHRSSTATRNCIKPL